MNKGYGLFLSCLHGSEPLQHRDDQRMLFLSCLHGSEQIRAISSIPPIFLSCLHGSELTTAGIIGLLVFSKLPTWQ